MSLKLDEEDEGGTFEEEGEHDEEGGGAACQTIHPQRHDRFSSQSWHFVVFVPLRRARPRCVWLANGAAALSRDN